MSKAFAIMAYQTYSLLKFCCLVHCIIIYPVGVYILLDKL